MWFSKGYSAYHCLLAVTKLHKGGVIGILLNNLSQALNCILLDLFGVNLHAHSLDSHIQPTGNVYLRYIKGYSGPCQVSMIDLLMKIGNAWLQVTLNNY